MLSVAVDTPGLSFGPLPPGLKILQNRISLEEEPKWLELLRPQYDKAVPAENTTGRYCFGCYFYTFCFSNE